MHRFAKPKSWYPMHRFNSCTFRYGELAELGNAAVLKTDDDLTVAGVQIPHSPLVMNPMWKVGLVAAIL